MTEQCMSMLLCFFVNGQLRTLLRGFTERDWLGLQNFYDSDKNDCPSEAGMYGMGSRSFFHIGVTSRDVTSLGWKQLPSKISALPASCSMYLPMLASCGWCTFH